MMMMTMMIMISYIYFRPWTDNENFWWNSSTGCHIFTVQDGKQQLEMRYIRNKIAAFLFYLSIPTSISLSYTKKMFLFSSFLDIFNVPSPSKQQVASNNVKQLIRHKYQILMWCRFTRRVPGQWHRVFIRKNTAKILQNCIFPTIYDLYT
jgi:hypothetical protein